MQILGTHDPPTTRHNEIPRGFQISWCWVYGVFLVCVCVSFWKQLGIIFRGGRRDLKNLEFFSFCVLSCKLYIRSSSISVFDTKDEIYIYRHVILVAIPKIQSLTSQLVCYGLLVYDIRKCSTKHQQNPSIVFFALGLRQSSVRVKRSTKQGFEFCGSMITLPPGSNQSGSHPGNIVLRGKKLGKIPVSWFPKLLGTMKQGFMSSI